MPSQFPPTSSARLMNGDARDSDNGIPKRQAQYSEFQQYQEYQPQSYMADQASYATGNNQYHSQRPRHESNARRSHEQVRSKQRQRQRQNEKSGPRRELSTIETHLVAMISEFVGTVMFLWFALAGTQSAVSLSNNDQYSIPRIFYIATVFGLSLLVAAWICYRSSGGLFNPAVTCGLLAAGKMPWMRALFILPAQIVGGIVAAALVSAMFPNSIGFVVTTLTPGVSITRGIFIEAFLTFFLLMTILMLAVEDNMARPMAPVAIGLALFVAELAGVPHTGGSLNPARSFGPAVVARSFPGYHYIYWFGPIMGALAAALYYRFLKWMRYFEAQPGQDHPTGEDDVERSRSRGPSH